MRHHAKGLLLTDHSFKQPAMVAGMEVSSVEVVSGHGLNGAKSAIFFEVHLCLM